MCTIKETDSDDDTTPPTYMQQPTFPPGPGPQGYYPSYHYPPPGYYNPHQPRYTPPPQYMHPPQYYPRQQYPPGYQYYSQQYYSIEENQEEGYSESMSSDPSHSDSFKVTPTTWVNSNFHDSELKRSGNNGSFVSCCECGFDHPQGFMHGMQHTDGSFDNLSNSGYLHCDLGQHVPSDLLAWSCGNSDSEHNPSSSHRMNQTMSMASLASLGSSNGSSSTSGLEHFRHNNPGNLTSRRG